MGPPGASNSRAAPSLTPSRAGSWMAGTVLASGVVAGSPRAREGAAMPVSTENGLIPAHRVENEGRVTTAIEERTAKVPSGAYLSLAVGSMIVAAALQLSRRRELASFVGLWAPSLLVIGLYNKVVKLEEEMLAMRD